jgi:hypothetical protein
VHRDVGVDGEEGRRGGPAEAIEASEDLVGNYGEPGPGVRWERMEWKGREETVRGADGLDKGMLEERVADEVLSW